MEEKHELSDIILEKNDNKSMKNKRILIIAALLIVLFLIVLVIMRAANKPVDQNNDTKLIIPTNPVEKSIETDKEDDLFQQVPIVEDEEKKESFEAMVKNLKEKEMKKQDVEQATTEVKETQTVVTPKVEKVMEKEVVQKVKVSKPKTVKVVPKKPKQAKKVSSKKATSGVYIQVGATSRLTPDKKFLAKLASKKYEYRLLPVNVKGTKVTKILVGPYSNASAARAVLVDVKSSINKDAFIYRVK